MRSNNQSKSNKPKPDLQTLEDLKALLPLQEALTALLEARIAEEEPIETQEDTIGKQ